MTEFGWKSRRSQEEDIFSEEDETESKSKSRVRPNVTLPVGKRKGEGAGDEDGMTSKIKSSPDSQASSSGKDKERRHKHKHNKHHHKHKKSRKRTKSRSKSKSPPSRDSSRRSRGDSRSRSRSRSKSREGRHPHRYREERDSSSRGDRNNWNSPKSRSDQERDRSGGREGGFERLLRTGGKPDCDYNTVSKNIDDDLDLVNTAQPFSTGTVPPAASKLKAEIEKRKQLWSKKDKPVEAGMSPIASSSTVWKQTAFSDDNDGKVSAKFKRLMGIKDAPESAHDHDHAVSNMSEKQRKEYFENLEKQYEVARATTHQQRGLGLGFSSRSLFPR